MVPKVSGKRLPSSHLAKHYQPSFFSIYSLSQLPWINSYCRPQRLETTLIDGLFPKKRLFQSNIPTINLVSIESMVYCLHLPNFFRVGWLWRANRGIGANQENAKYFAWIINYIHDYFFLNDVNLILKSPFRIIDELSDCVLLPLKLTLSFFLF